MSRDTHALWHRETAHRHPLACCSEGFAVTWRRLWKVSFQIETRSLRRVFLLCSASLYPYPKKGRFGFLASVDVSICLRTSTLSVLDASTLRSDPTAVKFPPPFVLHWPIPIPVWPKNFPQSSPQAVLHVHSWWNHWSINRLSNDWCWGSGILVVRLITKLLIIKQATKNLPSPPEECLDLITDVAHTPKSKETFAN